MIGGIVLANGCVRSVSQEARAIPDPCDDRYYRGYCLQHVSFPSRVYSEIIKDREYVRYDRQRLLLDVYLPHNRHAVPVILWVHGGGFRLGNKESPLYLKEFLQRGYAVVSIDYRICPEAVFPDQLNDVRNAVRWIRAHADRYGFDVHNIGALGFSAGGHLVSLLGTAKEEGKESSAVKAVVNFGGSTDLLSIQEHCRMVRGCDIDPASSDRGFSCFLGCIITDAKCEDKARLASPVTHVSSDDAAFLNIYGDRDFLVPLAQGLEFHERLRENDVDASFIVAQGFGHGGGVFDAYQEEVLAFFDRHLLGKTLDQ